MSWFEVLLAATRALQITITMNFYSNRRCFGFRYIDRARPYVKNDFFLLFPSEWCYWCLIYEGKKKGLISSHIRISLWISIMIWHLYWSIYGLACKTKNVLLLSAQFVSLMWVWVCFLLRININDNNIDCPFYYTHNIFLLLQMREKYEFER